MYMTASVLRHFVTLTLTFHPLKSELKTASIHRQPSCQIWAKLVRLFFFDLYRLRDRQTIFTATLEPEMITY